MNQTKQKAAPKQGANYDPEMSAMKQCKNILRGLSSASRQRVMTYLASIAFEPGEPPPSALAAKGPDPRQPSLPDVFG